MASVLPGAEPSSTAGNEFGVLVLHGFTGSPQSVRPLATAFSDAGYTVELPLLPGHGTSVEDMAGTGWSDWLGAVEAAYADLAARTRKVVVAGLSMGGTLSLALAIAHPEIVGVVLVNPVVDPTPFAPLVDAARGLLDQGEDYFQGIGNDVADPGVTELAYDRLPNRSLLSLIDAVTDQAGKLNTIQAPVLVLRSDQDHVVPVGSVELLQTELGDRVERVDLANSFHVATIDLDKDEIADRAVKFAGTVTA